MTPSSSGCRSASSDGARELRQLVEKQDAAMGERHLAEPRSCAAADDRGRRRRVVRRAKRWRPEEPAAGRKHAGDGMDPSHLERRVGFERRQDARETTCEHGLADPGRACEEQVVAAGRRDLERPPSALLSASRPRDREAGLRAARRVRAGTARRSRSPLKYATASARCRKGTGSTPASATSASAIPRRRPRARAPRFALPLPPRAPPEPVAVARRARARRRPRAPRAPPAGAAGTPPGRRARSAGRTPIPPSGGRPARGSP